MNWDGRGDRRWPCPSGVGVAAVFVVAWSWARAFFESSPCRAVTVRELFVSAVGIGEVSGCKDRAGDVVDQFGGGFRSSEIVAAGNVSGSDENGDGLGWRRIAGLGRGLRAGR